MKKTTKLLSVILAFVMALSCMTMMASAAKTSYQSGANLTSLNAYDKYGAVTRLDTEERLSIVFDALDVLFVSLNIPYQEIDAKVGKIRLNLTSVDGLCDTIDSVKSLLNNGLIQIALAIVGGLLGIIKDLDFSTWQSGMTRGGNDQLRIVYELVELLDANKSTFKKIINDRSINLGSIIGGLVDLTSVNKIIADIPGMIKQLIIGLLIRPDDNRATLTNYYNASTGDATESGKSLETLINNFVSNIFKKPMNWTSYRVDADGNDLGYTRPLPTTAGQTGNYYEFGTDPDTHEAIITRYKYDVKENDWAEDGTYYKAEEKGKPGVYIYEDRNGGENLKYYTAGDEGYFLPNATDLQFSLKTDSAATLLYKFAPVVFEAMVPVVANGSLKKLLGGLFGAEYIHVADVEDGEVVMLPAYEDVVLPNDAFFTQEQGAYLWEWSDYKVIDGTHYYRYEDQIFLCDTTYANPYFSSVINWNYNIDGAFISEFIPDPSTGVSEAGASTILASLNKFLVKLANEVLCADFKADLSLVNGDNSNLINNIKNLAQTFVAVDPASVLGSDYNSDDKYYSLLMSNNNQDVLCGIAATVVTLIMPQMILPKASALQGQKIGAVLAAVLRELLTQLVPNKHYDALIYSNYNTKTFVAGKDNSYWLDVILTMGTDVGFKYLTNLADMGEDQAEWTAANYTNDAVDYDESMLTLDGGVKLWEARVDYIIDWALTNSKEWSWKFENLVNTSGLTIALGSVQDPWTKLDKILTDLLPVKQILNCTAANGQTWLETVLRDNFVLAIADLRIEDTIAMLNVPNGYLRNADILKQVALIVKNLLNTLLYKVGGANLLPDAVNSIDTLLVQGNIAQIVENLLGMLFTAVKKDYTGTAKVNPPQGLLSVVLPIVNFFIGWTTDAQKYANPVVAAQINTYVQLSSNNYSFDVKVVNQSAGMLLKHVTSEGTSYDSPYKITITSVKVNGTEKLSSNLVVDPYDDETITVTGSSSVDDVLTVVVSYKFSFKDGTTSETALEQVTYAPVSSKPSNESIVTNWESGNIKGKNTLYTWVNFKGYTDTINAVVTNPADLKTTVDSIYVTWDNDRDTATQYKECSYTGFNSTYLASTGEMEAKTDKDLGADKNDNPDSIQTVYPVKVKAGVIGEDGTVNIPSGTVIALGTASTKMYGSYKMGKTYSSTEGPAQCNFGNLYYCDLTELTTLVNDELRKNRHSEAYTSESWAIYWDAFKAAALLAKAPISTANFATLYSDTAIQAKIDALNDAIEGLELAQGSSSSSEVQAAAIDAALGAYAHDANGDDHNFQDYRLFEYWAYERMRNQARDIHASFIGPKEPEGYIEGCWFTQAEIEALGAAIGGNKGAAIVNGMTMPTDEELADFHAWADEWEAPVYDEVEIENVTKNFAYYYNLMTTGTGVAVAADTTYLATEVACAQYNYPASVAAQYTEASWGEYAAKLAAAQAILNEANPLPSDVFDAKYFLMVAENNLIKKTESAIDTGYVEEALGGLITKAEYIFSNPSLYNVKAGVAADDAYVQLVKALGVNYTDNDGNAAVLFNRSALEFVKYDRKTTNSNLSRIDAAADALQAAIDNFVCTALESKPNDDTTVVETTVQVINGITPGSIKTVAALLNHVQSKVANSTLVTTASKSGHMGTGATVDVNVNEVGVIATYVVVIYGDVNGDGAVDAFDAIALDLAVANNTGFDGAYALAADVADNDGAVNSSDYSALKAAVTCEGAAISQVR